MIQIPRFINKTAPDSSTDEEEAAVSPSFMMCTNQLKPVDEFSGEEVFSCRQVGSTRCVQGHLERLPLHFNYLYV